MSVGRNILIIAGVFIALALLSRGAAAQESVEQQRMIDVTKTTVGLPSPTGGGGCICNR